MVIDFLVNPRSGRGRANALADQFACALAERRHTVRVFTIGGDPYTLSSTDPPAVAVIFGGDGTVHSTAPRLLNSPTPIYQVPTGTENLFAREMGMDRNPQTLLRALDRMNIATIDVGRAGDRVFVLMCTAGPDAGVVHRLASTRRGAIRRHSYVWPMVREAFAPTLGPFTIDVDGRRVVTESPGMVVVSNAKSYAMRIDPARDASMSDGLLDLVFFPASTSLGLVQWLTRARSGSHMDDPRVTRARGASMVISSAAPAVCQLDGDAGWPFGADAGDLRVDIIPSSLKVLLPQ